MAFSLASLFGFKAPDPPPAPRAPRRPRPPLPRMPRRHFEGEMEGNLTADWFTGQEGVPIYAGRILRARCRDMERNDGYFRRFLTLLKVNVFGSTGIKLEVKVKNTRRTDTLNKPLNTAVLDLWEKWNEAGAIDVTGKLDGLNVDVMNLRRCATDGEFFVHLVRGFPDNEFGFAVQLLETEAIDHDHSERLRNGNVIESGIELNEWRRPIAYWTKAATGFGTGPQERIPATDMIHLAVWERPTHVRAAPWPAAAVLHLRHLHQYEQAEVIASRIGASKMGFIQQGAESGPYTGAPEEISPLTGEPIRIQELAPGAVETLQPGETFQGFDPGQPKSTFPEFRKAILRGIGAALDVGYNQLGSDLEGVNYSSLKFGDAVDRQVWRFLQSWYISIYKRRIFRALVEMATLQNLIQVTGFDYLQVPTVIDASRWKPRGFPPIDPLKDRQAQKLAIDNLLDTRTSILSEEGRDLVELMEEVVEEETLASEMDVELSKPTTPGSAPAAPAASPNPDDEPREPAP